MGFPRIKKETCTLYIDITDGEQCPRPGEFVLTLGKDAGKEFVIEEIRSAYLVSEVSLQNRRNKSLPPRFNLHCYRSTAADFDRWWADPERDQSLNFFTMRWYSRNRKEKNATV